MILLNLALTFTIPGISMGGHLGGLVGGAAIAAIFVELDNRRASPAAPRRRSSAVSVAAFFALLVASFALARSKYPLG